MTDTQQPREVVAEDFEAVNSGSFSGDEWRARVELAAMYRLSAHFGYDDTIWNHITMRVPGSDHDFFLNKFGLLYDEVTASNLIKIDAEGNVLVEGDPVEVSLRAGTAEPPRSVDAAVNGFPADDATVELDIYESISGGNSTNGVLELELLPLEAYEEAN